MAVNASSVMSRHIVSAKADDTVADVARVMAANDISAMPVCDEDGTPIGMISEGDLLRPFGQQHGFRRSWWLHLLADGDQPARALVAYVQSDHRRARDLMTKPVITVAKDAGVDDIAALLLQHRIKRVPVVEGGKIIGIVSRADIIHALVQWPHILSEEEPALLRGGDNPLG